MNQSKPRIYPMNKPEGHFPPVQRYSAQFPRQVSTVQIAYLGVQSDEGDDDSCREQLAQICDLFDTDTGPDHFDFARYVDPAGYLNLFAVGYWTQPSKFFDWKAAAAVRDWWQDPAKEHGRGGYFLEAMSVPVEKAETLKFRDYIRGLSACPVSRVEAVQESAYWGAARDRIAASAYDRFDSAVATGLEPDFERHGDAKRVSIVPPSNLCVIRSGVTWMNCGAEQLASFEQKLKPKLDAGMEYLRQNPVDTGCYSLRQVDVVTADGGSTKEAYSLGYFRSLEDLETWAKAHPSHLAIYTRALAERKKYGERLELLTYHEVYVLHDEGSLFEYLNCHSATGLLPFFDATSSVVNE